MKSVRLGIIGMGNIGSHHADYLLQGKVKRCELVAVANTSADKLIPWQQRGLKIFGDGLELIHSGEVDAVLIATPHYQTANRTQKYTGPTASISTPKGMRFGNPSLGRIWSSDAMPAGMAF
jgi:homoserine dehydrogenase